jgi:chorismate dehydratase
MTVRVGHIEFLNCFPLYYGLQQKGVLDGDQPVKRPGRPDLQLLPGVPTQLNQMLCEGEIDFGPISSIAYARNAERLLLSRHVSISSLGAVESIQLVARVPLEQVRKVALTGQSATAVALLKTLLSLRFDQQVQYQQLEGPVEQALQQCDAVLLIGDDGLKALHFPWPGTACHDLGKLWQEWTGLPMVYAVWAAREDFALLHGPELRAVETELVECMDYGRERLPQVVESALGQFPFDRDSLTRYFELLRYDFTPEYQQGLRRFYELAYQAGELDEVPELRFIDEYAGCGIAAVLEDADPGFAVPVDEPDVGAAGRATNPGAAS